VDITLLDSEKINRGLGLGVWGAGILETDISIHGSKWETDKSFHNKQTLSMIRRLQPGYHPIGVLHSHSDDKPKIRYCQRCDDLFGVQARLRPKILLPDVPKQSDYDLWLECRNCGSLFQRYEVKVEPELEPIKQPSDGKQPKSQVIGTKPKKRTARGSNSRLKGNKWEIKDEELQRELKDGAQLVSYYSTDSF